MKVAVHEVSSCRIADRHHGEGGDEEEGNDTQRTVVEKLHPKVAYLHFSTLLGIHYHTLLTLRETEEEQQQTNDGIDGHGGKPSHWILRQTIRLLVGKVCNEQWKA